MAEKLICPITHIAPLLPHSGHMVLLDCITEYGDDYLHATAHVGEKHILLQAGSLPVLAGMEIMAQGIAALAGCHAHNRGEPVRLGFLLGTRKFDASADFFSPDALLTVHVQVELMGDNGLGMFDCTIRSKDEVCATARISVYEPEDGGAYVQSLQNTES